MIQLGGRLPGYERRTHRDTFWEVKEEADEELREQVAERLQRFGEHDLQDWFAECAARHARIVRTIARQAAVRNIRIVRERFAE
jgi:uncharacterized protein CbrC (UPF0167 family)